jgi:hypothetical protein
MKIKHIPFPKGFAFTAINLFGYFFINRKYKEELSNRPLRFERLIRHESIHTAQGKELLWVFFYLLYTLEWFFRLIQYRNTQTAEGKKDWQAAYRNISFEREAYANEHNPVYLKNRRLLASFRYIRI